MEFSETRRHQEDTRLTGAVENMRRLGMIRSRDPSWCPVTLSSEGRPLLAVSGSLWGPARCVVASSLDSVWSSAIAGVQGTGACSRLSRPVPGSRSEQGSHLPYTPRDRLRQQRHITIRKVPGWHVAAYPVQQRLRYVRGWPLLTHWGPPCSDNPVSSSGL